jgi:Uma2 family endonuclease
MNPLPTPEKIDEAAIDYESFVTEDNKPLDSFFLEKLLRLLTQPLFANWPGPGPGRPFIVCANVGYFYQPKASAVVPDVMLSLDATFPANVLEKRGRSYYQWDVGKPPDVVIEAVSDRTGGEAGFKKKLYARLGVPYYAIFDPLHLLSRRTLRTYERHGKRYQAVEPGPWPSIGLGLRLWEGAFETVEAPCWLRWCDAGGELIPTAEEGARQDRERARQADEHARQADERARQADERTRQLEEELRRLKGEPSAGNKKKKRS